MLQKINVNRLKIGVGILLPIVLLLGGSSSDISTFKFFLALFVFAVTFLIFLYRGCRSNCINISHLFLIYIISATVIITAGCVSEPGDISNNETQPTSHTFDIPPEPRQFYIKEGHIEKFTYWGRNITINYISAYPTQRLVVTVDGVEKTFQKELTDNPAGIYWKESNLNFVLKPVQWEEKDGQNIPYYEKTWNTTELHFEVFI